MYLLRVFSTTLPRTSLPYNSSLRLFLASLSYVSFTRLFHASFPGISTMPCFFNTTLSDVSNHVSSTRLFNMSLPHFTTRRLCNTSLAQVYPTHHFYHAFLLPVFSTCIFHISHPRVTSTCHFYVLLLCITTTC